jgi:hypothetical protein
MATKWNEARLQSYIDNFIEESLTLDYKAADALARNDRKKMEITKDVSAMANSAGGTIIYGLKEHSDPAKKHLAEAINPVDRTQFSKEWLEQIINNIRPRIDKITIRSISLSTGPNDVAYVVEIPQSSTAHQATDHRYYKRYNFESVSMEDHEVRDVMNRVIVPDADVEFKYRLAMSSGPDRIYNLRPIIKNLGTQVINNFRLVFVFPRYGQGSSTVHPRENVVRTSNENNDTIISYQSRGVLFPLEERDIGEEIHWKYSAGPSALKSLASLEKQGASASITWTLYADNMTPKQGSVSLLKLHDFM